MVPRTLLNLIDKNEYLRTISDLYKSNGFDFYLVGGAVRDGILNIDTKDFDFTTNALPDESIKLLNNIANQRYYGYEEKEKNLIFKKLEEAIREVKNSFNRAKSKKNKNNDLFFK